MANEQIPNADAVAEEKQVSLFDDQLQSFELGLLPSDHETIDDTGTVSDHNDDREVEDEQDSVDDNPASEDQSTSDKTDAVDNVTTDNESTDERMGVLLNLMKAEQMLGEDDTFEAKVENMPKVLDKVALNLFEGYVGTLPPASRDLMKYLSAQTGDVDLNTVRQFFDNHIEPAHTFTIPTDDEQAMSYLQQRLTKEKLFPSDDDLQSYLDGLLEKGKLLDVAVPKAEEEKASIDANLQQQMATMQQAKEEAKQRTQDYYNKVYKAIDEEPWVDSRKAAVRKAVDPSYVQQINTAVRNSPKAVSQLALLYSFFDEEAQSFNLSAFSDASRGKEANKTKEVLQRKSHESILQGIQTPKNSSRGNEKGFFETMKPTN